MEQRRPPGTDRPSSSSTGHQDRAQNFASDQHNLSPSSRVGGSTSVTRAPVKPAYKSIMIARKNHYADSDDDDDYEEISEHTQQPDLSFQKDDSREETCLEKLDKRFSHMINIESSVADSEDFPLTW
jgi:hypothetical protein